MKPLRHLSKYFRKYQAYLWWGFVFVTLSNLFGIFPAQAVRVAFDMVQDSILLYKCLSGFVIQEAMYDIFIGVLFFFAVLILGFNLIKGVFMYFMRQTLVVMSRHIEFDLKNEIFTKYQTLPLAFYRRNNTGDLMARISEDVSRVRMYSGPAIMYTMNLITTAILIIWMMLSVDAVFTLYVLIPLPFLSVSIYYVNSIINKRSDAIQSQLSSLTSYVQESFSGIRVIKAYGVEQAMLRDFEAESERYKQRSMSLAKVDSLFFPLMMLLIGLSTLITVYAGGVAVIKGSISMGNIAEFIIYVNMLTWPFTALGWVTSIVQRASASQNRINEFLQEQESTDTGGKKPFEFYNEIAFKNVKFAYAANGRTVLNGLDFTLKKGETLAIIGSTGSGKSTVASLLTRLYSVRDGAILVDGENIDSFALSSYRQHMAFVPQDVFLFSDTIFNNIAFGLSNEETPDREARVTEAARMAAVHSTITGFPNGYKTEIGERGISLSGGQKQRISLARALVRNPEILILDDCLSAVDTVTESQILSNFKTVFHGRTVLIISHRVSAVQGADQILMMEDGAIAERGTHAQLMAMNGAYAALYQKQLSEAYRQA
ncbi:MAG: ABC transporter ATP-binding protein [Bacteroidia bacterium]|nr:ABC transporter ATP-binding protein [Bacteroidia bacterium]